jgi:superfamily II RNA helicase
VVNVVMSNFGAPASWSSDHSDLVPRHVTGLLHLFQEELAGVAFPDVDEKVIKQAVVAVETAAAAVRVAEEAASQAQRALDDARETLHHRAHRALAYARVFAEEHSDLSLKVEALTSARQRSATVVDMPAKKRGRRPATDSTLFAKADDEESIASSGKPSEVPAEVSAPTIEQT